MYKYKAILKCQADKMHVGVGEGKEKGLVCL